MEFQMLIPSLFQMGENSTVIISYNELLNYAAASHGFLSACRM